MKLITMDVNF